ncbi:MAG: helix-turn-helix domain-containing protein [Candidatus Muiribacteriaceae bacterium]
MNNSDKLLKMIGKNIKISRIRKDLSQEDLAEAASIHSTHLSKIENGHSNVTLEVLYKIAESLEIEIQDLFTDYHA